MVKLPDASALGARDPRAVQGVPSFAPSPVPGALVGLGLATQRLAGQIAQERQDSRDFGLKSRFLQFEQEWDTHLADRIEAAEEGAAGFTEGILKDYETGARKLMQSVPDEDKPFWDAKLVDLQSRIQKRARAFETEERTRFAKVKIDEGQNALLTREATEPGSWVETTREGEDLIASSPLSEIDKGIQRRLWRERAATARVKRDMEIDPARVMRGLLPVAPRSMETVERIITAESGGRADARNPKSSALGPGQFIAGTWLDLIGRYRPDLAGLSDKEKLALRTDPDLSREMTARYAHENAAKLELAGYEATPANVYLMHFLGPGGALKLLAADPETPVSEILPGNVIDANAAALRGKTAADVVAWSEGKMGKGGRAIVPLDPVDGRVAVPEGAGILPEDFPTVDPRYADLPFEARQRLFESAERALRQLERAQDIDERRQRVAITKDGYDMMLEGTLTEDWIEANRDILSVTDYKAFTRSLLPGASPLRTDPKEYLRLLELADADPAEAIEEVKSAYGEGRIAKDVFNRVYSRANGNLIRTEGKSYATELRSYIRTALAPSRDAPQSHYARQLDAQFQFDDWLQANPDASREDIRRQAQTIIDDYRRILYRSGVTSLPLPRFTNATPDTLTERELETAKQRTIEAFQAGELTEREAAEQAAILRRWTDILRYRSNAD